MLDRPRSKFELGGLNSHRLMRLFEAELELTYGLEREIEADADQTCYH
jgi:hypothetical protein